MRPQTLLGGEVVDLDRHPGGDRCDEAEVEAGEGQGTIQLRPRGAERRHLNFTRKRRSKKPARTLRNRNYQTAHGTEGLLGFRHLVVGVGKANDPAIAQNLVRH